MVECASELATDPREQSAVHLAITSLDEVGDELCGDWQLHATFSGALMFRHYLDDSEMLSDVPWVPAHVRWSSALLDRASR